MELLWHIFVSSYLFEIMFAFVTISRLLTLSSVSQIRSSSGHVRSVLAQKGHLSWAREVVPQPHQVISWSHQVVSSLKLFFEL